MVSEIGRGSCLFSASFCVPQRRCRPPQRRRRGWRRRWRRWRRRSKIYSANLPFVCSFGQPISMLNGRWSEADDATAAVVAAAVVVVVVAVVV